MRFTLFALLLLAESSLFAQNVTNHTLEPKGVYKEINIVNDTRVFQTLLDTTSDHSSLIDSVERNPNKYIPPVLYALAGNLFVQKKYDDACYWFYVAQLRARYDVNRCIDKTANADGYNQGFGLPINGYAGQHLDKLKAIVPKVVDFVRSNEEQYDPRWISLTGMDAMNVSLGNESAPKQLTVDKSQWPAIKKKTIDTYYSEFKDVLGLDNEDQTVDRSDMLGYDFRLFKGTMAWELAKAVQNQDTLKISAIISGNKSLLESSEPKFGQTLLQMAVKTLKFESVKTLIAFGANPNHQDKYDGASPVTDAADIIFLGKDYGSDPRYLTLLLAHGGDCNIQGKGDEGSKPTPLVIACENGHLDYVKILVNAGAKVDNSVKNGSPFYSAVIFARSPEIVIYLIEKGVDYKKPMIQSDDGKRKFYLTDEMREWRFELDSDKYKAKMQLAEFLKNNGMDYWKTPIPEEYRSNYPKAYLEKY